MGSSPAESHVSPLSSESDEAYRRPPFSAVDDCLAEIDRLPVEQLATESLYDDIEWLTRKQRAMDEMKARRIAELDRRKDAAAARGPLDQWLHDRLHLTPGAAYGQVRDARTLESLPLAAIALRHGDISAQQAGVICQAMSQVHRTCLDPMETEKELVMAAHDLDARDLLGYWHELRYRKDQEAGVEAEAEQHERRWFRVKENWGESYRCEGYFDAVGGATLDTAIESLSRRRGKDDHRSAGQRRADALEELARRALDSGELPTRGGEKPHLMLVSTLSTLRLEPGSPLAQLNWGPRVTGETARRISCDAAVTPVLVDNSGGILHVGRRTRRVPTPTRRALNLRDQHCQAPNCKVKPEACRPHHRVHWIDGGSHDLRNLELFCETHHTEKHPENARFRRAGGANGTVQGRAP